MNGKRTILLVGGGLLQVPAVDEAKRQGFRVVATDRDPSAVVFSTVDELVVLDTKDVEGHVRLAKRLQNEGGLDAVFTEGADVEVTVAEAAAAVGLPGCDPRAARICSDKSEFRRVCEAAGLPGPRYQEVSSVSEALAALRKVGLPAIVKSLDNSASRGATKISSEEEMPAAFHEALKWTSGETVLVEECLTGPEQSVETLVDRNGRQWRCNIVDRPFAFDPFPIELGHDNPSALDLDKQEQLYELVEETTKAVGITLGAAKADTMWTPHGPVVLEMTARLSGGFHSQYTSPLAWGTNDIKAALDLALGRELDAADVTPKWERTAICRALFPEPGVITSIEGVQEALAMDGVEQVLFRMGVGDIIAPYRTCADRAGFVITCARSRSRALAVAQEADSLIRVNTEPVAGPAVQ